MSPSPEPDAGARPDTVRGAPVAGFDRLANANIARHLALMAAARPAAPALKIPRGRTSAGAIDYLTLSFAELDAEATAWCERLTAAGIQRGDRTLVMVRQGLPLIAAVFALFRLGAVPVVIDPGMGRRSFLACVARSKPRALVGLPLAQLLSHVFRSAFASIQIRVWASGSATTRLAPSPLAPHPSPGAGAACAASAAHDLAAILFTSGSTGAPKGVCYEHGMFEAQVKLIRDTYDIQPGEVDLPMLPIFALFNPALGLTTIVPEIDPSRPAAVDPAKIVQAIRQENVTTSFGSPTLWEKIGKYCHEQNITLPSLRRVLCAGAPVPDSLWLSSREFLSQGQGGQLHSPYGATEALPVATISAEEIALLRPHQGAAASAALLKATPLVFGACVGRPLPGVAVKVLALLDHSRATFGQARDLPAGKIGEIIVSGPMVTKSYDGLPEATAASKITDGATVWHRMGDCGYLDPAGRLWFCGRLSERVVTAQETLFPEPCEQVFRAHPRVSRCALIGLGNPGAQRPALVVEASPKNSADRQAFSRELRALARPHAHTAAINSFYFHPKFPVDVRHNAKIHRLELARWAATAKGCVASPVTSGE